MYNYQGRRMSWAVNLEAFFQAALEDRREA